MMGRKGGLQSTLGGGGVVVRSLTGSGRARALALTAMIVTLLLAATATATSSGAWVQLQIPSPTPTSQLTGVWCGATTDCVAVGSDASGLVGEIYNGSSWSAQMMPHISSPVPPTVSCVHGTFCMLVGSAGQCGDAAVRWTGTAWVTATQGLPAAGRHCNGSGGLTDVSCVSSTRCLAAAPGDRLWSWNGAAWSPYAAAALPKRLGAAFDAVSCATPTECAAVGSDARNGTLAAFWNGRKWTISAKRQGNIRSSPMLSGVSCVSASFCLAVGNDGYADDYAFAWEGSRWTNAKPPSGANDLGTVSCAAANACMVQTDQPSAVFFDGAHWTPWGSVLPGTMGAGGAIIGGISCPSAQVCMIVGGLLTSAGAASTPYVATTGF